jgi:hypothetical protein
LKKFDFSMVSVSWDENRESLSIWKACLDLIEDYILQFDGVNVFFFLLEGGRKNHIWDVTLINHHCECG